jgi:putative ABC transport system substrate-binding protein
MRRRQFIAGLAGAAAWTAVGRAQQGDRVQRIGLLQLGTPSSWNFTGFRQGLKDVGYLQGENLAIDFRWANDDPARLSGLAADLVQRQVRVIVALGSIATARAAKAATNTIPIVFGFGADPIQEGLVASLNRPGGNVTGMTSLSDGLLGKQFGILHELLPKASLFGLLSDLNSPVHNAIVKDAQAAASAIGGTIEVLTASTNDEIDTAFAGLANERHVQGLLVPNYPFFIFARIQLAILAARFAVPTIYPFREQTEVGGLLSYGPDIADRDRQVGRYVGRILKGEKPADLPVMQPTKFTLIINLRTAKALGLTIPETLLATADEVIQ